MLIVMQFQNKSTEKSFKCARERAHSFMNGNGKFTALDEQNKNGGNNEDNGEKLHLLDKTINEKSPDVQTSVIA